jgi:hypothetical protein
VGVWKFWPKDNSVKPATTQTQTATIKDSGKIGELRQTEISTQSGPVMYKEGDKPVIDNRTMAPVDRSVHETTVVHQLGPARLKPRQLSAADIKILDTFTSPNLTVSVEGLSDLETDAYGNQIVGYLANHHHVDETRAGIILPAPITSDRFFVFGNDIKVYRQHPQ